jgi:hypothetical protein
MSTHRSHRPPAGRGRLARAVKSGFAAVALTSSITALGAVVAAGGASAATAHPAVAVTAVTWHALNPINGWQSGESQFGTGGPAWTVRNGVVYLSGSVFQASGNSDEFAVLPAAARPAKVLYITVYTVDGTQGYLIISPDGSIEATASPYSDAQGYTSLASVSYPAKSLATHKLTLAGGWKSGDPQFGTGDPAYAVSGGMVYLSGSLHQPSGTSELSATLPAAARPARNVALTCYTDNGTLGVVEILPDGSLYTFLGAAQRYTSLAGISYPAAKDTVHKLALDNGWQPDGAADGDPSYWVSSGVVHLSGSMVQQSGTSELFAVLPKADRPAHNLYIQVLVRSPDETVYAGTVLIEPDGTMQAYSVAPGDARQFTSLSGISYPLGS